MAALPGRRQLASPTDGTRFKRYLAALAASVLAQLHAGGAHACATCGCSLSADAAMGFSSTAGWQITFQFDTINQNELRSGTHSVSFPEVAQINNDGGDQEVEKQTNNHYYTLGISYSPNADWNFRFQVPWVYRNHTTYGDSPNPLTPDLISGAYVNDLGDMRFIGSYQGFLPTHNLGVQLGIKLPTGNYGGPNADDTGIAGRHPVAFSYGPNSLNPSPDNLLDTSLQPGTGSTDLILGGYYYQAVSQNFDAFISGQYQFAVAHLLDQIGQDFRPGNAVNVSFGLRYEENPHLVPQIQVNYTYKAHDQGTLADTADTAGSVVYVSPGVTAMVAQNMHVYAFVQLPVYSNLQGYQVFPRWTASVGVSYAF
ncbi:MAG TPA: transporter [Casimicrobiaceae bacterium]|nr:transporter [Casimicrobiaceae bacterium]